MKTADGVLVQYGGDVWVRQWNGHQHVPKKMTVGVAEFLEHCNLPKGSDLTRFTSSSAFSTEEGAIRECIRYTESEIKAHTTYLSDLEASLDGKIRLETLHRGDFFKLNGNLYQLADKATDSCSSWSFSCLRIQHLRPDHYVEKCKMP